MSSTELSRAGTAAAMTRPRRVLVALGLVATLTGGGLVAQAGQASAAPVSAATASGVASATSTAKKPARPKPKVSLSATRTTVAKTTSKKSRPHISVKATRSGDAIGGRAKLVVNNKVVSTKKLSKGKARFNPTWSMYKVGKNKVRVVVTPSSSKIGPKSSRTIKITAKKAGSKVVSVASRYIGAKYVYGGSSPKGFDCSGFTSYVYKKAIGKNLPRSSSAQKKVGKTISRSKAKPGDLVWSPGHVAIYAGKGKVIEAARPGVGVVKRAIWQSNPTFIRVSSKAV
ncbi:NlpC/P60 family protein [Isoptericola sp. NEAU-Y5]|uniref:NlpC/P60 family protein n=1 Tax=Isoptericola luteus TaxID=2879484 RepID=A0ABS7ZAD1_9MICO|nr:C40 family peptidase [Isoptericola sp. NEAU-Y5]MCA5892023.1 NlpC/P60 family protein [Isoptericola sp. NEAU-Y5]